MDSVRCVEFLRARLDETERAEHDRYRVGRVVCSTCGTTGYSIGGLEIIETRCDNGHDVTADYNAALTPNPDERVLRDVKAKRAVVERYEKVRDYADPSRDPAQPYVLAEGAMRGAVEDLASAYSDHPDYPLIRG